MRCERCGEGTIAVVASERCIEVAGHRFSAELPAERCAACGRMEVPLAALERFQLLAARSLADAGASSGEAFAFMRRALGIPADVLGPLLDLTPAELARWDRADFVYRSAVEIVAGLIRRVLDGEAFPRGARDAADLLLSYRTPRPLAKTVRLDLGQRLAAGG